MKICKNCAHFHEGSIGSYCKSPRNGIDLVTGEPKVYFAHIARGSECGVEAHYYEEKKKEARRVIADALPMEASVLSRIMRRLRG